MEGEIKKICVVGLGYIGLPTASVLGISGFNVTGVDVDEKKIETLSRKTLPIHEPGLKAVFEGAVNAGTLSFTTQVPDDAQVYIICVPTPVTPEGKPDLSFLQRAGESVVEKVKKGDLIIVESTVYPGASEEIFIPLLKKRGFTPGKDVHLAHCPERVIPGKIMKELLENDRVIGGLTPQCAEKARAVYEKFVEGEIFLTDIRTAEMVKLAENTFRMVNIALAMELARIAEKVGVSVWEVIWLANHHPRVNLHSPGPGMGGHCLPVDPYFLVHVFPDAVVTRSALETNKLMIKESALKALDLLAPGEKACILGVAYKGNVDDPRESPGFAIGKILEAGGIKVSYHDPLVKHPAVTSNLKEATSGAHLIIVVTDHTQYRELPPHEIGKWVRKKQVLDLRAVLKKDLWTEAGFTIKVLGDGRKGG